jgi:putative NIF3 family GTP cyclohydrolase 1 type 2
MAIDVGTAELLLARELGCDAVIAHHPIGISSVNFHRVFNRHFEFMVEKGVPEKKARLAVQKLKQRVENRTHAEIYDQVIGAAKALKMPLVNIHQPCDEYMRNVIVARIKAAHATRVSDLIKAISTIPEFRHSKIKPVVRKGKATNKVGKSAVVIAAGTNGGYGIAKAYFESGIDTVIYLHIDYGELLKLKEENVSGSLVVLGHLAGDSIGMNGLAARLERRGVKIVKIGILPAN